VTLDDLATPAVLVDRTRARNNIQRMQDAANRAGIRMRPHAKTHKSPTIAQWQILSGAVGICCAKLGEAEVFSAAGVADIRVPYPINPVNAERVIALLDYTRFSFIVDHLDVALGWSYAMNRAGRTVDVLVKVDVGFHRCGINPALPGAVDFLQAIARMPGLNLLGILAHAGHGYHAESEADAERIARDEARTLNDIACAARSRGLPIEEVSAGATPTARYSLQQKGLTEYRCGNYVFFDRTQVGLGAATFDDCAMSILARVVSKPAPDRIILDCGSKTLSSDAARGFSPLPGHGAIFREVQIKPGQQPDADLIIERLSEEHATVRVASGATSLEPGNLVRVVPNHACVVTNLVDAVWLRVGDQLEPLEIVARGKIS
jgi:D-serine deaminase-like pyridoxal phosphate-dependent protein